MYADPLLMRRIEARIEIVPICGCWIWMGTVSTKTGYGQISVRCKTTSAHRAAYEAAHGTINGDFCVCHTCDVRCCVNPAHLFLGTIADNQADMSKKDRSVYGQKNGRCKLTNEKVLEIRHSTEPQRVLARRYGIGQSHVHRIRSHQVWKRA